ncbi:four-carbon acid sugar kinase family protein [Mediterraneibacter agrestimuris]|uniref:four-carbon acid sugar kinase family protein n=1 Tax=Mediterraneibacter agrestimuris TaxID=2941333 RepID=UPI00203EE86A|nr:four-carbon acid sugar kinase family protein [Mediterraneibacter agrestimuris]
MEQLKELDISVIEQFPKIDESKLDELLQKEIIKSGRKIIVLDDDPTGVQTVHGVSVYTDWSQESIAAGFAEERNLFYILTNSRGFTVEQTTQCHQDIISRVQTISKKTGQEYLIISRGDSTLRGHYPLETELLRQGMETDSGKKVDGEILCPFFKEGGRYTIGNVHYVKNGGRLVPAGQTEFAADKTFGYQASDLRKYVEEKTKGRYRAEQVLCISLEELRARDIDGILKKLIQIKDFGKIVVNAVDYCDLKVFAIALYQAMAKGKQYLFRTAAALVKVMGGISDKPLLTRKEMLTCENTNGGIIVVGSHTMKTTSQLEELKKVSGLEFLEFNSDLVLDEEAFTKEIHETIQREEEMIRTGKTVVVYTKRKLLVIENDTKEEALLRSVKISDAVQSLVGKLSVIPSFVIAKGGITSSDVGTKALQVKRADVMGQIRPGIPVWKTGEESRFPGIPYVIFPGNVGEVTTLREAVEICM